MRVNVDNERMHQVFEMLKDNPVFSESAEIVAKGGNPIEMFQAMSLAPGVLNAFTAISEGVYPGGGVEREVKEIIILEASRANACQFCTETHIAFCRMMGMADQPLDLLDQPEQLTPRQQLAMELTRTAMADSNLVPDELFDRLREHYRDAEIVEITFMIGFINCLNIFNNVLHVRYRQEYST